MKNRIVKRAVAGALISLAVLAIDRLTKVWAAESLTGAPDIIPGVLGLRLARNTGVAFSMFSGATAAMAALTAVVIAAVIVWLLVSKNPSPLGRAGRFGMWLLAAGGLGNLYDRLLYGYVVDMIEFRFMNFAVFNVADICVCAGAALAVLGYLITEGKKEHSHAGD